MIDKTVFFVYTVDGACRRIDVSDLRIPHPGGVLLGGNGIGSKGRVLINAGVKFIGRMPDDEKYLRNHAEGVVFELGKIATRSISRVTRLGGLDAGGNAYRQMSYLGGKLRVWR